MTFLDVLVQRVADPVLFVPLILSILYFVYCYSKQDDMLFRTLPWVGKDPNARFFVTIRTMVAGFSHSMEWLQEGYDTYSTRGKSYIFPCFMARPEVMVPSTSMEWLLGQPENVLSTWATHYEFLEGEYAFTDKRVVGNPWHERVVYKALPRKIGDFIPDIWDEVSSAFDDSWGTTEIEKDVVVFETTMKIISRVSNRMFIGAPLCRNDEYLNACKSFANQLIPSAMFLTAIPKFLRPVLGPPVSQIGKYQWRKAAKYTIPLIEEHLRNTEKKDKDASFNWAEPNIFLSWAVRQAQQENNQAELDPDLMSRRLMALNFAAIHTTTITATNLLLDLFSADQSKGYLEGIREEITRVFAESNGVWNKAALAKLIRTDSAIRESMRVSTFVTRGLIHKVVAPGGIRHEKEGYTIPYGTNVAMDVYSIMNDPKIYPQPSAFDAFRFSRPREEYEALPPDQRDSVKDLELRNLSMVTTGNGFFSFGHGRHSCPGRFFVSHELKLMIAYIVMNYDIAALDERPKNLTIGQNIIPPAKATMRIKRRGRAVVA